MSETNPNTKALIHKAGDDSAPEHDAWMDKSSTADTTVLKAAQRCFWLSDAISKNDLDLPEMTGLFAAPDMIPSIVQEQSQ